MEEKREFGALHDALLNIKHAGIKWTDLELHKLIGNNNGQEHAAVRVDGDAQRDELKEDDEGVGDHVGEGQNEVDEDIVAVEEQCVFESKQDILYQ